MNNYNVVISSYRGYAESNQRKGKKCSMRFGEWTFCRLNIAPRNGHCAIHFKYLNQENKPLCVLWSNLGAISFIQGMFCERKPDRNFNVFFFSPYFRNIMVNLAMQNLKHRHRKKKKSDVSSTFFNDRPLTHLGFVSHICLVKNSSHIPSDVYVSQILLYLLSVNGETRNLVPGQGKLTL